MLLNLVLLAQFYSLQTVSLSPQITTVTNFLSEEECDYLIELAKPNLKRSTVVDPTGKSQGVLDERRTSEGTFFGGYDPVVQRIEKRLSDLTNWPMENGEQIQVLHYNVGGEYQPHFDFFSPDTEGNIACLSRGGQRIMTVIMYLNTPEEGGETIFPRVQQSITPQKGNAVLFYNCDYDGNVDPFTLHGGAPVKAGEKWIATKWFRLKKFR